MPPRIAMSEALHDDPLRTALQIQSFVHSDARIELRL